MGITRSSEDPSWPDHQEGAPVTWVVSAGSFINLRLPEGQVPCGWKGLLALQFAITLHMICICFGGPQPFLLAFPS